MRHNRLLALAALVCAMLMSAQSTFAGKTKVFTEPRCLGANTKTVSITKVEFTDSATIVSFHLKFKPGSWVKIANDSYLVGENIAKKYMVIKGEGIVIGEQHTTPESGEDDFKVLFEPMPKNTRAFDFIEGVTPNGFSILGVHDRTRPIKIKTPKKEFQMTKGLEAEFFKSDTVRVRGRIEGYSPDLGFKTLAFMRENPMRHESTPKTILINEDGSFEFSYLGHHPKEEFLLVKHNDIYAAIFIYTIPGQTTEFVSDLQGNVTYTKMPEGPFARNISLKHDHSDFTDYSYSEFATDMEVHPSFSDFCKTAMCKLDERMQLAEYIYQRYDYSPWERHLSNCYISLRFGTRIFDHELQHSIYSIRLSTQSMSRDSLVAEYKDINNLQFMRRMPYNDPTALVFNEAEIFFNRYEFTSILNDGPTVLTLPFILHQDTIKAETDKKICGQDKTSFFYKAIMVRDFFSTLNLRLWDNNPEIKDSLYRHRRRLVEHSALQAEIDRIYEEDKEKSKLVTKMPLSMESIKFRQILDKYKGKYVMVDFWGMGCGPCRQGIRNSVEMRKGLRDNPDIEFVFINATGESSPEAYKEFVDTYLEGEEVYEVSTDEYNMFMTLFKFNGIPHYEFFDREGNIINDKAHYTNTAEEFLQLHINPIKEKLDK